MESLVEDLASLCLVLRDGSALVTVAIWRVNQQLEDLSMYVYIYITSQEFFFFFLNSLSGFPCHWLNQIFTIILKDLTYLNGYKETCFLIAPWSFSIPITLASQLPLQNSGPLSFLFYYFISPSFLMCLATNLFLSHSFYIQVSITNCLKLGGLNNKHSLPQDLENRTCKFKGPVHRASGMGLFSGFHIAIQALSASWGKTAEELISFFKVTIPNKTQGHHL